MVGSRLQLQVASREDGDLASPDRRRRRIPSGSALLGAPKQPDCIDGTVLEGHLALDLLYRGLRDAGMGDTVRSLKRDVT
jgi:hypothetical protein